MRVLRRKARGLGGTICALVLALTAHPENWPGWRGPRGDGTSLETNLPIHWSEVSNVLWRVEVPGSGHASPIVWNDRVFTVSAILENEERRLICFERATGKLAWQQTVLVSPLEHKHSLNSYASSTPATDGELVFVAFLDVQEMVVAAYDLAGQRRWLVRPGVFKSMHGFCSSPVLYKDLVIVNGDHDGDSYLVALNRTDGRIRWKTPRQHHTRSYCTPFIRDMAGKRQMVLSGDRCVASYNPVDGSQYWEIDGPTEQFVASLVYNPRANLLFLTAGFPEHHNLAIRPDGVGNVTQTHIAWRTTKGAAYVPGPISIGDYFLTISDQGFATCFQATSGKLLWQERLGEHHASLVSANGLVYFLSDQGVTTVVRPGPAYAQVAQNELGEPCFASPALSEGQVFIRSYQHLYCIGTSRPASRQP